MLDDLDLGGITDAAALSVVARLLNVVEELGAKLDRVTAENQRLRDENSRLKGEQPRPRILPARPKGEHASERERRETPKAWHKGAKLPDLPVDRVEECRLDRGALPEDAALKDYQEHTVQELVLHRETILFRRERYEAASTGRTYTAPLPPGYGWGCGCASGSGMRRPSGTTAASRRCRSSGPWSATTRPSSRASPRT